ncbi:MAG: tRNA1(Val) (adenine(37)-N6)-methyltransferase [Anaerovoracaceae bacterium]
MSIIDIENDERIDNIGFGEFKIIQKPEEFCYGIDAVIISDFVARFENGNSLKTGFDLGTGTGIIPLILSHKLKHSFITGIEVQEASYNRAQKNKEINNLNNRINFINANVTKLEKVLFDTADFVVSNPPYMECCGGLKNDNKAKMIARHEIEATLPDFFEAASKLLKPKGKLYMVHRPSRLPDIFEYGRKYGLEPKQIRFVKPNVNGETNIVLIQFAKNGGKELKYLKDLIVYENGEYTDEIKIIYEK